MGDYAFLWGQKKERTPTWYGMFLKSGESTAVVDELTRHWTGSYPRNRAPMVEDLTLNSKNAIDNVYLKPGEQYVARVNSSDPNGDSFTYKWLILTELVERIQGGAREQEPENVSFNILSESDGEIVFSATAGKEENRLFAYIYDGNNKSGTANIPFMVD